MKTVRFAVMAMALAVLASALGAAPAYYEGFEYIGTEPVTIGPAGSWYTQSGHSGWTMTDPGASYMDAAGNELVVNGRTAYQTVAGNKTCYVRDSLPQEVADLFATEGTIYITMLIKEQNDVWIMSSGSGKYVHFGTGVKTIDHYKGTLECQGDLGYYEAAFPANYWNGTQYDLYAIRIVNRVGPGEPDEVTVLRNPNLANPDWNGNDQYSVRIDTVDITDAGYDRLVMWGGGASADMGGFSQEWIGGIDEIRIARTWADAAPYIPADPGTGQGFYEGFEYEAGTTVGPGGGWTTVAGYNPYTIQSPGATYVDAAGNQLNARGNLAYQTVGGGKYDYITKPLPPSVADMFANDGTFYITFLLRENSMMRFTSQSGKYIELDFPVATTDWYKGQLDCSGTWQRTATYWYGLQYDFYAVRVVNNAAAGQPDEVTFIRNPSLTDPDWETDTPYRIRISSAEITAPDYDTVLLFGGAQVPGLGWAYLDYIGGIDEIRVARDWADAAPYTAALPVEPIDSSMKNKADGEAVNCWGIVTAEWLGYFYIESPDRSAGIRVEKQSYHATVGNKATVRGTIGTLPSGERYIACEAVGEVVDTAMKPLGMTNKALGGGDIAGQDGVADGSGLNNIGLLVRAWGRVSNVTSTTLTLDDGSGVSLKAYAPSGGFAYSNGEFVTITGISSCERVANEIKRVLLVP